MLLIRPMHKNDIPLFLDWLTREHLDGIYQNTSSPEQLHARIQGHAGVHPYIAEHEHVPFGYLQWYRCCTEPALYPKQYHDCIGVDLFIGETTYLGKGFGKKMLVQFCTLLHTEQHATRIIADPSVTNLRSIRTFMSAGFTKAECFQGCMYMIKDFSSK